MEDEQGPDALWPAQAWKCGECEDRAADGERRGSGQRDDAVVADQDTGGGKAVNREQRRHDAERRSDENDATVTSLHADRGECDRRESRDDCADSHTVEVHAVPKAVRVVPEQVQARNGHDGADQREILDHAIPVDSPHQMQIGSISTTVAPQKRETGY